LRILYVTRGYTAHDRRFLTALASTYSGDVENRVYFLRLEKAGPVELPAGIVEVDGRVGEEPLSLEGADGYLSGLQAAIDRVQPDLVHAGPVQLVARLVARTGFRPLVTMSWGSDLLVEADRSPAWQAATREALSASAVLLGDCQAVREKAISLGFPDERIVTFPWGVDLRHFSPGDGGRLRKRHGWEEAFVVLSLRSWEPIYGVDVVARAFVRAAQGNPRLRLLLLGAGSQEEAIRRILAEGEVLDRVMIGGPVSLAELPEIYRAADLYLSASHSDGSSISLLEALACGRPALVSAIPGNREWVTPGQVGWLFPDGDDAALAEGILQAARESDHLAQMGRRARRLAEERGDWEKNFPKLLDAYKKAISDC